jgi:hypothetical protein
MFLEKIYFFTRKPTKLVLHFSEFSTIFNDFSKLQLKTLEQLYSQRSGLQLGATATGICCLGSRGGREVVGRRESSGAKLGGGSGNGERRRYTGSMASL